MTVWILKFFLRTYLLRYVNKEVCLVSYITSFAFQVFTDLTNGIHYVLKLTFWIALEDFRAVAEAATASAKLANDKADRNRKCINENSTSISKHSKMLKFLYIKQAEQVKSSRRTQAVVLAIVVFLLVVHRSAIADNLIVLLDIIKRFWE